MNSAFMKDHINEKSSTNKHFYQIPLSYHAISNCNRSSLIRLHPPVQLIIEII